MNERVLICEHLRIVFIENEQKSHDIFDNPIFGCALEYCFKGVGQLESKRILDLGCGYGEVAIYFGLQGADVVGLDINSERIELLVALAKRKGIGHKIDGVVGSSNELPFLSSSFDIVFARSIFQYVDIDKTLAEIQRVLKPTGSFLSVQNMPYNPFILIFRLLRYLGLLGRRSTPIGSARNKYFNLDQGNRLTTQFQQSNLQEFHLLFPIVLRENGTIRPGFRCIAKVLKATDRMLIKSLPALRQIAWMQAGAYHGFIGQTLSNRIEPSRSHNDDITK